MSLLDIIQKRYSCRSYHEKEIEQDKLDKILKLPGLRLLRKIFRTGVLSLLTEKETKSSVAGMYKQASNL